MEAGGVSAEPQPVFGHGCCPCSFEGSELGTPPWGQEGGAQGGGQDGSVHGGEESYAQNNVIFCFSDCHILSEKDDDEF